jgi:hypothetical protein
MNCLCWLKIHKELKVFELFKSFSLNNVFLNFQTQLIFASKIFQFIKESLINISNSIVLLEKLF